MKRGRKTILVVVSILVVGLITAGSISWFLAGAEWRFNGDQWQAARGAPACEDPLTIGAPMDLRRATSKLYPGQVRGEDFKPHGGLAIDDAQDTNVTIYAIRDAKLVNAARYIENGAEQILLDFIDPCGLMYRYDHLATVSPAIAAVINSIPVKVNDSRTTRINGPIFPKGAVIATQVGQAGNVGFDLGVYDLRQQNEVSKTDLYKTDQRRIDDKEQSFYALCWFNLLPPADQAIVDALPSRSNAQEGVSSDYCSVQPN